MAGFRNANTWLFHRIKRWDKGKRRMTIEQGRPLVFLSTFVRCQLLPRLTCCLGDGFRASLPSLSVLPGYCDCVNRLPLLPGLNERLLRLPSGCKEITRWWQLCNGSAGQMTATMNASQCFKRVFEQSQMPSICARISSPLRLVQSWMKDAPHPSGQKLI